ncbi:MAG: T9SS type A sorting domain-containing protein [bacterium]|nr:T9SS type A sorting domain-containing protein [bacterium]
MVDGEYQFEWAKVTADTFGHVYIYYGEVNLNSPSIKRVQYVSTNWQDVLPVGEGSYALPNDFSLSTYPNPFNSTVRIDYELSKSSDVQVSIFNTLGQQVATLFNGHTNAGTHTLNWSPDAASGVYFVKLASGEFVASRKILYIR